MRFADPRCVAEYECADDLMQAVIESLLASKERFKATKGDGVELLGVSLRLANPRARLSRSEMRGKIFSALGEFLWCLSGSKELSLIRHYISSYDRFSDDGKTVFGAYGPRLFGQNDSDQVRNAILRLKGSGHSRKAVMQIFGASDLKEDHADVPCTCTLQAILRDHLNLIVHMRSNDAYLGLPHDIFVFTMIQELMARALGVEVGFYQHFVGHLHLYDHDKANAEAYLGEDVQSIRPMPPMPFGDPWDLIPELVGAEAAIRGHPSAAVPFQFGAFWEDIVRLLRVHSERHHKLSGFEDRIVAIKNQIVEPIYRVYIS